MSAGDTDLVRKNQRTGLIFLAIVFGMVGMSFASVPLYRLFCQVTGFGGTPTIDANASADRILDETVTVRFNADVSKNMPWLFKPDMPEMTLNIGQKGLISFHARNDSQQAITGTAIYNVLPERAARYFIKTQCFCFDRQVLEARSDTHMPVMFFVDPKITEDPDLKDVRTITLSYTFFRADSSELEQAMEKLYQ